MVHKNLNNEGAKKTFLSPAWQESANMNLNQGFQKNSKSKKDFSFFRGNKRS